MHEMLGNQCFLARNYLRAAENLEKALWKTPGNKLVRRKLIICYTQIGKIENALQTFLALIKEDIDFIMNSNPVDDDCPCSELVFDMERKYINEIRSLDANLVLGMLWLYCDLNRSFEYFKIAQLLNKQDSAIKSVLTILSAKKKHLLNNSNNTVKETTEV